MLPIALSPAFTMRLPINPMQVIGPTPTGDKVFLGVLAGGTMTLPDGSLAATFTEGADFATLSSDGFGKLDVRVVAKTVDSGELLYVTYFGHLESTAAVSKILAAAPDAASTSFDDHKLFVSDLG
jgi:Protein of unknown function (DUF3237)